MAAPSKLSDLQWDLLFQRDAAGEARWDLAAEHGICVGTIARQARLRGRRKGDAPGATDRRRRPGGGWPEDHMHPQSLGHGGEGMTPRLWEECLDRYLGGWPAQILAADYGVSVGAIRWNAREQKRRKCDSPEAIYRPRGPAATTPGRNMYLRQVKINARDGAATRASLGAAMVRAIYDDDWKAVRELMRIANRAQIANRRLMQVLALREAEALAARPGCDRERG